MIIKSLQLTNFRNHASYELFCDQEISLILGPNGFGKTSVLEAIYILLQGKSFRATDPDILQRGKDFYRIELSYQSGETVAATYDGRVKTFLVADQKFRRLPKKSKYPIVLFEPPDLNLIQNSPSSRRAYFDRIFSQFDASYAVNLARYAKALKQRNELLKSDTATPAVLFSWNVLLAQHGLALSAARTQFVAELNSRLTPVYRSIATNSDAVSLDYLSELAPVAPQTSPPRTPSSTMPTSSRVSSTSQSPTASQQSYLLTLERNFDKDRLLGHTTFGPHRDDFVFRFNRQAASVSASRGESRTIILALKFIEADLIRQKTALPPLILLDDVFSELDATRRQALITNFQNHQIILTSVENVVL